MRKAVTNLIRLIPSLSKGLRERLLLHMLGPDCYWTEEEKSEVFDALYETASRNGETND